MVVFQVNLSAETVYPPLLFLLILEKNLWRCMARILQAWWPSCYQTNSVKALKESKHWP